MLFGNYDENSCAICGNKGDLSGEHKFKASIVRDTLGSKDLVFFSPNNNYTGKSVQGVKSNVLHFNSKICRSCNSAKTQKADRAFEKLRNEIFPLSRKYHILNMGVIKSNVNFDFDDLELYRYFAKILLLSIIDNKGPRIDILAQFAGGLSNRNIVQIDIKSNHENLEAVCLGALMCFFDKDSDLLSGIGSSIIAQGIEYTFRISFCESIGIAIENEYIDFVKNARKSAFLRR